MKRLDKFLVEMSVASRSVIKEMAKKGRITVNGEVVKASDIKIDENSDVIAVDGMIIAFSDMEYFMLNKPAGVITATMDKKAETVLDLIDERSGKNTVVSRYVQILRHKNISDETSWKCSSTYVSKGRCKCYN